MYADEEEKGPKVAPKNDEAKDLSRFQVES
jgi:hypothetical protein